MKTILVPRRPEYSCLFLVAHNDDTLGKRRVSYEEGMALAQESSATYFEVSTRRGTNCEDLF